MANRRPLQEVNIALGDQMSEYFYEASKLTRANRPECLDISADSFEGTVEVAGSYLAKHIMNITFGHELDGIGTKPEISERCNEHFGSAQDLFAMVGDDVAVRGGEIITIDTILDVRELNKEDELIISGMSQLAEGMVYAAKLSKAVVLTGEIAELGKRVDGYGDFNYNWSGVAWYVAHKERKFTGKELQPGHKLVGFVEPGFRSNGITDVRNAMLEHYGEDWHNQIEPALGNIALGKLMQTPSTIYAGLMNELHGGWDIDVEPKAQITGVAHITGGGQPSKLGRMLKRSPGLGITIDKPISPPEMMLHVQNLRGFSDEKAYGKWHMGPGLVVATPDSEKVIAVAQERGITALEIGIITDEPGIRILNMGAMKENEDAEYIVFGRGK
jgi:phosphoribosylformylglycinamidine cyclo-ligase